MHSTTTEVAPRNGNFPVWVEDRVQWLVIVFTLSHAWFALRSLPLHSPIFYSFCADNAKRVCVQGEFTQRDSEWIWREGIKVIWAVWSAVDVWISYLFPVICTQFHYNQLKHTHRHTHASTLLSLVYILAKCKSFCLSSASFVAVNYILFTHKKTRRLAEAEVATKSFRLFTIQINVNMCICIYLYVCLCISRNTLGQQNENGDKSKQSENICYSGRADETDWESATQWERNVAHALKSFLQAPSFVYNSSRRCLCVCVRERV